MVTLARKSFMQADSSRKCCAHISDRQARCRAAWVTSPPSGTAPGRSHEERRVTSHLSIVMFEGILVPGVLAWMWHLW